MNPTREQVFGDDRPFEQCHASSLVVLPDGRLAAAWFGGDREGSHDVAIWWARRDASGWGRPERLAQVRDDAHWNPVLFCAPDGELWCFFKVGATIERWETWVVRSLDAGDRWSDAYELVPGDRGGRGPVRTRPIVLSSGDWLAGASLETAAAWDVFVDRSEDSGRTWTRSELLARDPVIGGRGVIQPTLWEPEPGHVRMLARSTGGFTCESRSEDDGRTWSTVRPIALPNNNSGIDVCQLADGSLVVAHNPVGTNWGARTPLSLSRSADGGRTFVRCLDIEDGPGEYSYPAILAIGDDLAMTYTWRRQRIGFWRAPVSALIR